MTSEYMSGRILGVSKTATVSTRVLFLSSGNNVGPVQDMTRRCITIHLDPGCEVPAARTFIAARVGAECAARTRPVCLGGIDHRASLDRGRQAEGGLQVAGGLSATGLISAGSRCFGWGVADPTESVFEAMAEDPDRETLADSFVAWQAVFGRQPAMVRDAVKQASSFINRDARLREVLHDIADERGEINRRRLGWWIKRHAGRIVDGRRFVRASGNRSAEAWYVESVSPVSPVSLNPSKKSVSGESDSHLAYARASRGY